MKRKKILSHKQLERELKRNEVQKIHPMDPWGVWNTPVNMHRKGDVSKKVHYVVENPKSFIYVICVNDSPEEATDDKASAEQRLEYLAIEDYARRRVWLQEVSDYTAYRESVYWHIHKVRFNLSPAPRTTRKKGK